MSESEPSEASSSEAEGGPQNWRSWRESLAAGNASLRDAMRQHGSWGRAISADEALNGQVRRLVEQLGHAQRPTGEARPLLEPPARAPGEHTSGPAAPAPEAETTPDPLRFDMMAELREFQERLNALNAPSFASRTQAFLTHNEALRYRGSDRLWHYTTAPALNQILTDHVLWASSPHHLNDTSELTHGVQRIDAAIREASEHALDATDGRNIALLRQVTDAGFVEDAMNEIYYISASNESDSLTLWRNYSTSDGFALGLRPGADLSAEGLVAGDPDSTDGAQNGAGWYRVHYRDQEKDRLSREFVAVALQDIASTPEGNEEFIVQELRKQLLVLASVMKHRAFEDEREVRWITTNWVPVDVVHYELTGRGIVPVMHARATGASPESPHLPITGLRCSPTTPVTIERTMRGLLGQRGYDTAAQDVSRSTLPFRG